MREHVCPKCNGTGKIYRQKKGPEPIPVDQRFWSKVKVMEDSTACWEWQAHKNRKNGYGYFSGYRENKNVSAHRVAYELYTGEILTDLDFICHKCHNRICCNPNHLYKGDAASNMRDMIEAGRMKHPPQISGWESPNVKISKELALEIRSKVDAGEPPARLAKEYNVGRTTVGRIRDREGIFKEL